MQEKIEKAKSLLKQFKGDDYVFGVDCFDKLGMLTAQCGQKASLIVDGYGQDWAKPIHDRAKVSLAAMGVELAGDLIAGAGPNAPREDVFRIKDSIEAQNPDVIIAIGGGSVIDAAKAAAAMTVLSGQYPDIESYFGVGKVSEMYAATGLKPIPLVAVQLASGSGAHLTKYSNITDYSTAQKKLIVDASVIPTKALFDYSLTTTMPRGMTMDGGLDGIAHALEVFYGLKGDALEKVRPVALLAIDLIVNNIKAACEDPQDLVARETLGLGTDLGGYSIMIGGTNGAHLTSFSLVDVLSHGRACALMNPYYTVFFAPAIEDQLQAVGAIFKEAGYLDEDIAQLKGRQLGVAVADAMLALSRDIGFPVSLSEVEGFSDDHIKRALSAAKNPQLKMKLQNMPVPLSAEMVDEYMGPILQSAKVGDFNIIKNLG